MRPGGFSQAGFLGTDESLRSVLEHDGHTLAKLGVTADDLADSLDELLAAAINSKATAIRAGPYTIRIRHYKGPQACPYAVDPHEQPCLGSGNPRFAAIDWSISNSRNGVKLSGPGLIVHLIKAHGFFEGLASPYRVPPERLAELLELGQFASSAR
jgi:hypothetical protein